MLGAGSHFEVVSRESPNANDLSDYPRVKSVSIVSKSILYEKRVRLSKLGITGIQYGKCISEEDFDAVLQKSGQLQEFRGD